MSVVVFLTAVFLQVLTVACFRVGRVYPIPVREQAATTSLMGMLAKKCIRSRSVSKPQLIISAALLFSSVSDPGP